MNAVAIATTDQIIGGAITVHRALGPGLLESAYRHCLVAELLSRELRVECEKPLQVNYRGLDLECAYRLDLVVENEVLVEVTSVSRLAPIHSAQLLSYLRLSGIRVGLLINFNVTLLKDGIRRLANGFDVT